MGLRILRFKFNYFLWVIVAGMAAMIISFLIFMTMIYSATKHNEMLTYDSLDIVSYGFIVYWNEVNNTKSRDKAVEALKKLGVPSEILVYVEKAKSDSDALIKLEEASFDAVAAGDLQKATQLMSSKEYEAGKDKISQSLNTFEDEIKKFSTNAAKQSTSKSVTIIFVSLFVMAGIAYIFINSLKRALNTLDKLFISIADGDMTVKAPNLEGSSEISETFKNINLSLASIREILQSVTEATEDVASSNNQLASTMEELSSTFSEQAHQVGDTAASLDSINSTVKATVDSLKSNQEIVDNTVISANDGRKQLTDLKMSMEKIHEDADSLSDTITNLANSSSEIGNIVTVINDIADQTNLLALNAAIEAARAGEAGRGFAVVADEVRKLAERTQQATSEVTAIVSTLQNEALRASSAMGLEAEKVKEGVNNIERTEDVFNKIFTGIDGINGVMSSIREDMDNEYSTVQTVHETSTSIATGIEESSNAVNEVTQTIEHLQERVETLKMMLTKFKVK